MALAVTATHSLDQKPIVIDPGLGAVETLSEKEQAALMACEAVIQEGWHTFVQVGLALAQIRDGELYRAEFDSFEAYYRAKWDFEHSQVYYLIAAAQLFNKLRLLTEEPKPDHASQLRPLLGLEPEAAQQAWVYAAALAGGRPMNARLLKRAVKELRLGNAARPGHTGLRTERAAQWEAISGAIGELLKLISERAAHDRLLSKVQILEHHLQRLRALGRKRQAA